MVIIKGYVPIFALYFKRHSHRGKCVYQNIKQKYFGSTVYSIFHQNNVS